jgi:dephospho-CoA kinase
MGPAEAGGAAIGKREIHIYGLICDRHVAAIVAMVVPAMDMSTMYQQRMIVMVMIASQMRMQRTERREHKADAGQQEQNWSQARH